jgi:squalene-hopene/tetraprenyl-beta-curcumene cyclase
MEVSGNSFVLSRNDFDIAMPDYAWNGLGYLLSELGSRFREAAHTMPFPRAQGFCNEEEDQVGQVFQRALIVDALCDFNELTNDCLRPVLDAQIRFLLDSRRRTGVGGWSYFPSLRELPSDADDTAQVMQALLRTGFASAVAEFCVKPISILLSDGAHADGSFETWILPETSDPEIELQKRWVNMAWGSGPDCEVIANLLYSLWLYDAPAFAEPLTKGIQFVVSRQQLDGSWKSTWYHGPFYGTWVCVRLLAAASARPAATVALNLAREFLWRAQRDDGGWGYADNSDGLNTAFALLALRALGDGFGGARERVAAGLEWLRESQSADGSWRSAPFIRMDLGRPTGKVWQTLTYQSRTITTAFACRAALAWGAVGNFAPESGSTRSAVEARAAAKAIR